MSIEPAVPRSAITRNFPSLAYRDYRLLFINSVFGAAAHWALLLARGWLVYDLTGSSTAVGLVTFAGMAPNLFVAPVAGALADRYDRRTLSLYASYISFAGTLGLAAVTLAGIVAVWHVTIFAFLSGIARAVQQPTGQAMVPNLVAREHLLNGIALQSISNHGSRLVGPLLGGVLLTTVGAGTVFALSAVLFFTGALALWMMRYRIHREVGAVQAPIGQLWREIASGFEYVGRDRRIALVIVLVVFHCALTMAFDSMMPQLAVNVGGSDRTFTAILMGLGAGAVIGTVFVSRLSTDAAQGQALAVVSIGSGLAMIVLGMSVSPAMAIMGAMLAGGTQASFMALAATFVQSVTPDHMRGRVMSIYVMLAGGNMAFVNLGFGTLADFIGVWPLLVFPGLIWMLIFLGAAFWLTDLRYLIRSGTFATRARVAPLAEAASGGGGGGG